MELYYDDILGGTAGHKTTEYSKEGVPVPGSEKVTAEVVNGQDIVLSIDVDMQQKLEELEQMVIDARFECTGPQGLTTTEYEHQLTKMLKLIRSIDEVNES